MNRPHKPGAAALCAAFEAAKNLDLTRRIDRQKTTIEAQARQIANLKAALIKSVRETRNLKTQLDQATKGTDENATREHVD